MKLSGLNVDPQEKLKLKQEKPKGKNENETAPKVKTVEKNWRGRPRRFFSFLFIFLFQRALLFNKPIFRVRDSSSPHARCLSIQLLRHQEVNLVPASCLHRAFSSSSLSHSTQECSCCCLCSHLISLTWDHSHRFCIWLRLFKNALCCNISLFSERDARIPAAHVFLSKSKCSATYRHYMREVKLEYLFWCRLTIAL